MFAPSVVRIRPARLHTTRQHRTFFEHILIRFPALVRALSLLRLRLPIRSRLRRLLLLRLAAQASAAVNRRDFDLILTGLDPELDWLATGDLYPADLAGHHHGHAGYREVWSKLLEAFEDLKLEPEELMDTGDRIVSMMRATGHGAGSGVPVRVTYFQVFTFRAGLIIRLEEVRNRTEALEAAGLSELGPE